MRRPEPAPASSAKSGSGSRIAFTVDAKEADGRLDETLANRLSRLQGRRLSKSQARKLIVVGAVAIGGRTVRQPGRRLPAGARVAVFVRASVPLGPLPPAQFGVTPQRVLYEDDVLIAVDKPAGLPTQPTVDAARPTLVAAVKRYLGQRAHPPRPPQDVYLGVHQRLDRDTSGVVVFAKDPKANAGLALAFEARSIEKAYLALTLRPAVDVPRRWRAVSRLGPAAGKPPRMGELREGGQEAVTDFEVQEQMPGALLLVARPRTGRKHQIRVQLAARGLPILGDVLYGGPARVGGLRLPRTLLHAAEIQVRHPVSDAPLRIVSRLPLDFSSVLASLKPRQADEPLRSHTRRS